MCKNTIPWIPDSGIEIKENSMSNNVKLDVMIVGGGMITNDLILPSVYHLQRVGVVGRIQVCALN